MRPVNKFEVMEKRMENKNMRNEERPLDRGRRDFSHKTVAVLRPGIYLEVFNALEAGFRLLTESFTRWS